MSQLKLPELGEGIEVVDVSAVLVDEGDFVKRDQPVIEVETEKASLEVPSAEDGQIVKLLVKAGDQLKVGQVILEVEAGKGDGKAERQSDQKSKPDERKANADEAKSDDKSGSDEQAAAPAESDGEAKAKSKDTARSEAKSKSKAQPQAKSQAEDEADDAAAEPDAAADADEAEVDDEDRGARKGARERGDGSVVRFPTRAAATRDPESIGPTAPAAPSSRALARELGVDIHEVTGSGPGGRISRDDVKAHAKRLVQGARTGAAGPAAQPELPDFKQWGSVRREPLSNVRRATARGMATAWATVPHVTQFDQADVTQLESMRKRFNKRPEAEDRKLTMTAIAIKMVGSALRQFPKFNASLDLAGDAVVFKDYVHVGCAVDTDRGLLVPVLRDVDRKSLLQVTVELNDLAERARAKKVKPDEMRGATFTVSNLGGLGTTYFSPIVNWPEVAILGVGRATQQAVFEDGQFQPRLVMPLSLSYDHRLIDGADAARFLRRLAESLEQPLLLLLDD